MALHHLGLLALEADHDNDAAWSLNEHSLAITRRIGDRDLGGNVLIALVRIARARGEPARARASLAEAIVSHRNVGDVGQIAHMTYTLAAVDADAGQLEDAVRLAGTAAKVAEQLGVRVWPVILRERDACLEPARRVLGEERFAREWANGQAMTREQTADYALEDSRRE
jgi:hypothetical protein